MYNLPNEIWISMKGIKGDEIGARNRFRGHVTVIGTFRHFVLRSSGSGLH